ncbi:serpin family protein [soil metagenome]
MTRSLPLFVFAAGLSACGSPTITDQPIPAEPERPFHAAELAVASASDAFGVRLLRQVAEAEAAPNLLISPLSASLALGMTLNGAQASTYTAMRDALGFTDLDQAAVNDAYRGLIPQLLARDPDVEFTLANALWYRRGFDVKQPFKDAAHTHFRAHVADLDFSDPAAPRTISQWAEDRTGGRIQDLVEQIDPLDMLFLVNAVYFKAPWAQPFHPNSTRDAAFVMDGGSTVMVPTMTQDAAFPHLTNDEVQAVELPYAEGDFAMLLLAPPPGFPLRAFVAGLTTAKIDGWLTAMQNGRIMLSMPKFSFEYDVTMNDALIALGMGVAFDPEAANFDGIHDATRNDLYISKVRQKAFIDVHELGTEAAAATSVTVGVTSMPPVLAFDRPFLFAIRERESGAILFIGLVGDPSAR